MMKSSDEVFFASIFSDKYYRIYRLHAEYTLHSIFSILHASNVSDYLQSNRVSCEEFMKHFNAPDRVHCSVHWMLNFLTQEDYLEKVVHNKRIYFRSKKDIPVSQKEDIAQRIVTLDKNWYPFIALIDHIASEYESFLKGFKNGVEILFYKDKAQLWNNYFNNKFSGYSVFNICGAYGMSKWITRDAGSTILELGGGTGGAAVTLFETFRKAQILDTVGKYVFSDVSPVFLRMGNRILTDQFPEMNDIVELKKLDFNKSLSVQKMKPESYDAVYSVNALHVSHDLLFTLREIYTVLKENGILVLSELVRREESEALPQEIIFTLLDSYYNVKTDSALRKNYGFLTPSSWKNHLETAGFGNIEVLLNTDHGENRKTGGKAPVFLLVIKGEKTGSEKRLNV